MASLEQEFDAFFADCRKQGFTATEMRAICQPLLQRRNKRFWLLLGSLMVILTTLYLLYNYCDEFNWFLSAIGRLVLIQLLPFWDWTPLYNSRCLIERAVDTVDATTPIVSLGRYETDAGNCVLCETLERISTASNVTFSYLEATYLERGLPVIVTDSHQPRSLDNFLNEMYAAPADFLESSPCDISTNLMLKKMFNLELALDKIKNASPSNIANKWFLQFRNCQRRAVKASRHFVTRPYYYPLHLEPFYSSWGLMSQNYANEKLRDIYLHGLIFVQQLYGYFDIRLKPKQPCDAACPVVNIRLDAGECLIFSTDIWTMSYGTETLDSRAASIATVLEIDWQL